MKKLKSLTGYDYYEWANTLNWKLIIFKYESCHYDHSKKINIFKGKEDKLSMNIPNLARKVSKLSEVNIDGFIYEYIAELLEKNNMTKKVNWMENWSYDILDQDGKSVNNETLYDW
jgi:hypothetical protein|tara:strand:- start:582 stop:929 length:348 start_codon:yes stop_codon:yes gene_type:complete